MATIFETVSELGKIVTDAITAGNDTNIPERIVRSTLIKVSTGSYKEVLPIVVPAECCILGDELRSTNVQPRKATNSTLTPMEDFNYSFEGFKRFEAVIEDIVSGVSVTPTIGNNETQITSWPLVENTNQKKAVSKLIRNIRKRIDVGLGTKKEANLPKAYTLPNNNGWAIELIKLNKEFLKAEVVAYLQDNYPTLAYSKTKCKQDIGFLIDSISYDLIYGGNWQSVKAGEAYYEGTNFNISTSEKTATIAVYGVLRDLMVTLSTNIEVTPTYQSLISAANPVSQIRDQGYSGDANSSNRIISLMNNIISIVTNGTGTVAINYPDTSNVASNLSDADITMRNLLPELQVNTIDFINGHFGSFQYNSAKCRRDLNYIITDTAYDVALGTNYNAVFQGTAYQRPVNAYNTSTQRIETIGAVRRARDLLKTTVTTDGSSEVGSSTSSDRITTAYNEIVNMLNGNAATALSYPDSFTGITQERKNAKDLLIANKTFLIDDTIAYITSIGGATYDEAKCRRDVGYIVESLIYDLLYGGTQATTRIAESYFVNGVLVELENGSIGSLSGYLASVYTHVYSKAVAVILEVATATSGNPTSPTTTGNPAGNTESGRISNELRPIVVDVLFNQSLNNLPAIVFPDLSALGVTSEFINTVSNIESDKNDVIRSTVQYITNTYNDFNYDHEKCSRDIAFIVNAASYDMMLNTNFASIQAAYSYLRAPSKKVVGDQKTATLAANEYVRSQIVAALGSNTTAIERINQSWEWIQDIIFSGSNEGSNRQTEDVEMYNAVRHLELNKEFIVNEVLAYVDNKFKDTVIEYTTDTNELTISDTSWLFPGMPIKFRDGDDSSQSVENAFLNEDTTYYVKQITGNTTFTISESKFGALRINYNELTSGNFEVYKAYEYNRLLCARDVREYIDAAKWDLVWAQESHRHYNKYGFDVVVYLPGMYKTRLAARYYVNSVIGSQEEDMYYLRNGTGLRLQTVDGLQGDLGPANSYGTQRPTAGAYASLDPGWGPDDQRVWITARSPYVQNVTTFGYAAVGQKIDGSLHNGGNDSIVSNDFTQVISDGIGAWLLNNGRAELVSVFTYYAHIGYLSESGGRIRATNGNNSYGKFGSVAEGVDAQETPVTAITDNRTQYKATVSEVYTDTAELLQVEYNHAGNDYTEAELRFFGVGFGESQIMQEFRDEAVNQIRVVEIDDSAGNPDATAGGANYLLVSNTAQAGALTNITIAATDGNSSTAYPGMAIYITGGVGAGQYGVIDTYNAGSKVATVKRMTDGEPGWDHAVSGTTIVAPNSTSIYQIEPQMYYSSPAQSDSSHTLPANDSWTDPHFFETSNQYTNLVPETQSDGSGATFDVTRVGEKYYVSLTVIQSPNVFEDGENYSRLDTLTIKGSQLGGVDDTHDIVITITVVDSATGAIVDFDFSGYGSRGYFVIANDSLPLNFAWSRDGETWTNSGPSFVGSGIAPLALGSGLLDDGSSTYAPSRLVIILNDGLNSQIICRYASDKILGSNNFDWQAGGTLNASSGITGNIDIAYADLGNALNRFVVCTMSTMYYSDDGGLNWSSTAVANNYTSIAYGQGVFIAIVRNGGTQTSLSFATSTDGINWVESTEALTGDWVDIAYGKNKFVVIDTAGNGIYTLDGGSTWNVCPGGVSRLPNGAQSTATTRNITYGQGMFAVTTNSGAVPFSEDGVYWTNRVSISGSNAVYSVGDYTITNGPDAGTFTTGLRGITFGNNDHNPIFVARAWGNLIEDVAVIKLGCTTKSRVSVANSQVYEFRITEPGSGYTIAPDTLLVDPNNTANVLYNVRLNNGVLAQPTFTNRGTGFISASAEIVDEGSNGNADFLQDGNYIAVSRLSATPVPGSNVVFDSLPGKTFKLVNTVSLVGLNDGSKKGFLQISPKMEIEDAVVDKDPITLRIRFSQVRLTGHDFLDIGTGNFEDTNYPNEINGDPVNEPDQTNETVASDGGRVFFTATDQDGNFRVGDLFSIEQATGVATLSADAFNIAGLQELTLGEVTLGGNSASITEFSTDEFFTANSDSVIPTQRAIKAYIEAQIGGGGASIIVNSVTAGDIYINTNQITTLSGQQINIKANVNFTKPVVGLPLAYNYFLR